MTAPQQPDADPAQSDAVRAAVRATVLVARAHPPGGPGPRIIAVDGPSGAGKTTIADLIATCLGGAPVLHMDDVYPGWDGLAQSVTILAEHVLAPLSQGRPGSYRRWDWHRDRFAGPVDVPAGAWLVIEGVGCGSRSSAPYLASLLWLTAERSLRLRRGLARDGAAYEPHWTRWAAQEARLFTAEQTAARADVVLDTTAEPSPGVR